MAVWVLQAAAVVALVGALWFVVRFHVLTGGAWRQTAMGRHVMAFMAVIAGILSFTVARQLLGDYPGRRELLAVGFALFAAVVVQRAVLLEREQHRPGGRRGAAAETPPPGAPGGGPTDPRRIKMRYAKALLAVGATGVTALIGVMTDGAITPVEWVNVAIAGVGACAVFAAPNVPGARYTKSVLAVLAAVLAYLVSAIVGGVSVQEWMQVAVIGLGAVGIYAVPNAGQPEPPRLRGSSALR